jgi:VCBS repeat-containing protein
MNTKSHYSEKRGQDRTYATTVLLKGLLILFVSMLFTACQFAPVERTKPTGTPAAPAGAIGGLVWIDECEPSGICPTVTPGLTQNTDSGDPAVVQGLGGLEVSLGQGPCPSLGLASSQTEPTGSFNFPNLQPGFYCVSVRAGEAMSGQWTAPQILPSDRVATYTIALGPGEKRQDLQFVWKTANPETPAAPTPTPTAAPTCTNRISLVDDVTIEDGTRVDAKSSFKKVWRIRNEGSCTWTRDYEWVFVSGYQLGAPDSVRIPAEVSPGVMMDMSLDMTAPAVAGTYRSYWMMRSPSGELIGTGSTYNQPVWVEIKVGPEPTPVITEWRAEYFDNRSLDGDPALVRNDKKVDFDWGRGAPAEGLPSDNFSARWSRTMKFDAAIYRFSVVSDDGVRLWVDDRLVIDEWTDSDRNEKSVDLAMVRGNHDLRVEYYEHNRDADIELTWTKVTLDDSSQWVGHFWFNRQRDSKWALVKTSSTVDFDWGTKSPALGIPADDFSASWTQTINFEEGRYRFSVLADDGVRVYLDEELIIDEWHDASGKETYSVERELSGTHNIEVLYYEHVGSARIEFESSKIGPANQAPSASSDSYETVIDRAINILDPGILENDSDPDNDTLTAIHVSGPAHGELNLHENGAFSYMPENGYSGADSFTYKASDGNLLSSETVVTISIRSENHLPSAVDDSAQTEEDRAIDIDVLANDRDLLDAPIEIKSVEAPNHGTAVITGTMIRYTPAEDYSGDDRFTYTISDRDGDESSAIVSIQITAINDAPQAVEDSYTLDEDGVLSIAKPGVLENDLDVDSSSLTFVLIETTVHGTLNTSTDGSFTYTPEENYYGEDSFTYQASDGSKSSNTVVVTLIIEPVDDPPTATPDSYSILAEPELVVSAPGVLGNDLDPDGDKLTAVLDQRPANGTLDFSAQGGFTYTPASGFEGVDTFTYWVEDGVSRSKSVEVQIEVAPASLTSP